MRLSVVIAVTEFSASLRRCVGAVDHLEERSSIELMLVAQGPSELLDELRTSFKSATVIRARRGASFPEMRGEGARRASGDVIAFLGERYLVGPGWGKAILRASHAPIDILVGLVDPQAGSGLAARAIHAWEYGHLAGFVRSGELTREKAVLSPGGNSCYRADLLRELDISTFFWELDYHAALFDQGRRFVLSGEMTVSYQAPAVSNYLEERYQASYHLAVHRAAGRSEAACFLRAGSRLLLPFWLLAVSCRRIGRRGGLGIGRWVISLPCFIIFAVVQAVGELAGYVSFRATQRRV